MRRLLLALVAAGVVAPATAHATVATLTVGGPTWTFKGQQTGTPDQELTAHLILSPFPGTLRFTAEDLSGATTTITASGAAIAAGCTGSGTATVNCPVGASQAASVVIEGGQGDDVIRLSSDAPTKDNGQLPGGGTATLRGGSPAPAAATGDDEILNDLTAPGTLSGGDGNDVLDGGIAAEDFAGGDGTDTVRYSDQFQRRLAISLDGRANDGFSAALNGSGTDEGDNVGTDVENVIGGMAADVITGNSAANVLNGGPDSNNQADILSGGGGADTLNAGGVGAGAGADELHGGTGNDTLNGNAANNRLVGGAGADIFNGGGGADTADYSATTAGVQVMLDGAANDGAQGEGDFVNPDVENVIGGSGSDLIIGGTASSHVLEGGPGTDALFGGPGDDTLSDSGGQGDFFTGHGGTDTVTYAAAAAPVSLSIDGTANDGPAGEADNIDASIENLVGGEGDDVLIGTAGTNQLRGNGGDDLLRAGLGADSHVGGNGFDTVDYSDHTDGVTVTVQGNNAPVNGSPGEQDRINPEVEAAIGTAADDTLSGGGLANRLDGGAGADQLNGGEGDDVLRGGAGDDVLVGGAGQDVADYSERTGSVSFDLAAGVGGEAGETDASTTIEALTGGSGADALAGDDEANVLDGGAGADVVDARAGNDTITGGAGADEIDAGAGDDTVALRDDEADTLSCAAGTDAVVADLVDVLSECESLDVPPSDPPPSDPPPSDPPPSDPPPSDPPPSTPGPPAPTGSEPAGAGAADRTAPGIARLRIRGSVARYRLSEPARVRIQIRRLRGGRAILVRTLPRRVLRPGAQRVALGRLRRGRYRITVVAIDAAGNRGTGSRTFARR